MVFLVIPNLIGYRNALASSIRLSHSIVKTSKFLSDALACLGSPPPRGSKLCLDTKFNKNQACTKLSKNQIFGLEIKELAALKQLLFLTILQIDFLR